MTRRTLRPGERALWDKVARHVVPLKPARRDAPIPDQARPAVESKETTPKPAPRKQAAAPPLTPKAPKGAKPATPKPLQAGALERPLRRRLSRGSEPIDGRLDLHGMTQAQAHGALIRFVSAAFNDNRRNLLVITGKGRGGDGAGILRRAVPVWLRSRELTAYVSAFGAAHKTHGGDGALYVRLRRKGPPPRPR